MTHAHISIAGRKIGDGEPCYIIAEAGSNHNGKLEQAFQLIDVAAAAGADAVKFQIFRANRLYTKNAGNSDYLKLEKPIYDIIAEMETPYDWLPRLSDYCAEKKILFLASVFDEESLEELDRYVAAHKIASYEMTHHELIRATARKGKPLLISTGTADLAEVEEAVSVARESKTPYALFQCTAAYPAPPASLNLRAITTMKRVFGVPVGLSDHSQGPVIAPVAAVACGASLIEKHFTLSRNLEGPDHRFSAEPDELRLMVGMIRETEEALGSGRKETQPVEQELRRFARRSIFAIRDIAAGETLNRDNAAVLRCGNVQGNLAPKKYPALLGRKARVAIPAGQSISEEDFE